MRSSLLTAALMLLAVVGCTVTARDRLKHFFFEIPESETGAGTPESITTEPVTPDRDRLAASLPPVRFVSIHEPFRAHDCGACHDAAARMQVDEDMETTCGECHDRYFSDAVGHGPVAGGECLLCHDPHRSAFKALLRTAIRENCTQCHDEPDELSRPAHAGVNVDECTRCHDPHFGEPPLLKPGVRRETPKEEAGSGGQNR